MTTERDPLKLGSLPWLEPPQDAWAAIEAELAADRRRRRRLAGGFAAAAVLVLALGIVFQWSAGPRVGTAEPGADAFAETRPPVGGPASPAGTPADEPGSGTPGTVTGSSASASLESLVGLSQQLERNLRLMRGRVGSAPAELLVYQVELEDLVAQVDEAISLQPNRPDLWSQRVNLLLDLNQLYGIELRREYGVVASL